jgi:hypothetical protein
MWHGRGSSERRVHHADQFSDPPTAKRGGRAAPEDVHHHPVRKDPRLRDVVGLCASWSSLVVEIVDRPAPDLPAFGRLRATRCPPISENRKSVR